MRSRQKLRASRSRWSRVALRDRSVGVAFRRIVQTGTFSWSDTAEGRTAQTSPIPTPHSVSTTTTSPRAGVAPAAEQYCIRPGPANSTRTTWDMTLPHFRPTACRILRSMRSAAKRGCACHTKACCASRCAA
jgi:hypothetical protein